MTAAVLASCWASIVLLWVMWTCRVKPASDMAARAADADGRAVGRKAARVAEADGFAVGRIKELEGLLKELEALSLIQRHPRAVAAAARWRAEIQELQAGLRGS